MREVVKVVKEVKEAKEAKEAREAKEGKDHHQEDAHFQVAAGHPLGSESQAAAEPMVATDHREGRVEKATRGLERQGRSDWAGQKESATTTEATVREEDHQAITDESRESQESTGHQVITGGESIGRIDDRDMTVGMSTAAETIGGRTRAVRSRASIRHRDQ